MKYSVIIPAYQAENTIARCLDSLLAGIRNDAEILIVNDGSNDRTEEICLDYASRYPRIRYFLQEHRGVSAARNLALDHACGEYIMFVDSDDYVFGEYFPVIDARYDLGRGYRREPCSRAKIQARRGCNSMETSCLHYRCNPQVQSI